MSRPCCRNSVRVALALLAAALVAASPPPFALEKGKREPIVVTSRTMKADKLGDIVTFSGDVVLKKEALTLNADTLVVFYDAPSKTVREIEAQGNVVVTQEGRVALAHKAVYYSGEERIVLTGDPRIIENENQVGGERITLFMRSDRSIVEGGKVLFYQDKVDEGKMKRAPGGKASRRDR
jgi:lipopolysaccharide export system protein LptA